MASSPSKKPHVRMRPIEKLTSGTWPGTDLIIARVIHEARLHFGWRPLHAAIAMLDADLEAQDRVWMTPDQFKRWRIMAAGGGRKRRLGRPEERELGISAQTCIRLMRGERPIPKRIALACAHHAMGFEPPIEANDSRAFREWMVPRFGEIEALGRWLEVAEKYIPTRLAGVRRGAGVREEGQLVPMAPEMDLIRAIDWVYRVGPVCPYGVPPVAPAFPGQRMDP